MAESQHTGESAGNAADSGLVCLAMLARFFEKPGDYEQLRHRHGAPDQAAATSP